MKILSGFVGVALLVVLFAASEISVRERSSIKLGLLPGQASGSLSAAGSSGSSETSGSSSGTVSPGSSAGASNTTTSANTVNYASSAETSGPTAIGSTGMSASATVTPATSALVSPQTTAASDDSAAIAPAPSKVNAVQSTGAYNASSAVKSSEGESDTVYRANTANSTGTGQEKSNASATLSQPAVSAAPIVASLKFLQPGKTISGTVPMYIESPAVDSVEVYVARAGSISPIYLGNAGGTSGSNRFVYVWDSKQTPNGDYEVFAKLGKDGSLGESNRVAVSINNQDVFKVTPREAELTKTITQAAKTATSEEKKISQQEESLKKEIVNSVSAYSIQVKKEVKTIVSATGTPALSPATQLSTINSLNKKIDDREATVKAALEKTVTNEIRGVSTQAVMNTGKDVAVQNIIRASAESFKSIDAVVATELGTSTAASGVKNDIQNQVAVKAVELKETTAKREALINERVGLNVFLDGDHDGVSDYDEVYIYKTNPFVADADGDGVPDGVEILTGHNPLKPDVTVPVSYEDPRVSGEVVPEKLKISNVSLVSAFPSGMTPATGGATSSPVTPATGAVSGTVDTASPEVSPATARTEAPKKVSFTGVALPNSFITIYIYSNPIVVTVKTDSDGNWNYTLDKELSDGKHDVYVAVTDNAGKIVAKSDKFSFVKEAQALTIGDVIPSSPAAQAEQPSFFTDQNINLLGLVVFSLLGLVLVALSFHRKTQEPLIRASVSDMVYGAPPEPPKAGPGVAQPGSQPRTGSIYPAGSISNVPRAVRTPMMDVARKTYTDTLSSVPGVTNVSNAHNMPGSPGITAEPAKVAESMQPVNTPINPAPATAPVNAPVSAPVNPAPGKSVSPDIQFPGTPSGATPASDAPKANMGKAEEDERKSIQSTFTI